MNICIDIVDIATGNPLAGATVFIGGKKQGTSDANGFVYLNGLDGDQILSFRAVGYNIYSMPVGMVEDTGQVQLSQSSNSAPAAMISPSPSAAPPSTLSAVAPWIITGIAVWMAGGTKIAGIGAMGRKGKAGIGIALGAVAIGGIYLMTKPKTPAPLPAGASNRLLPAQSPLSPGSTANLVAQGTGLFSTVAKLFSPSTSAQQTAAANAANPNQFAPQPQPSDITASQISPASAYQIIDPATGITLAPPPDIAPPVDSVVMDNSALQADATMNGVPMPLMPLGCLCGLALMGSRKSIGEINYTPIIMIGGIGLLAYLLINKLLPGATGKGTDAPAIAAQTAVTQAAALKAAAAKQSATINAAQASSLANDIYAQCSTYSSVSGGISDSAASAIVQDLNQINNDTDFYAVSTAFGTKQLTCNPFGYGCTSMDLLTALRAVLSADNLSFVNNNFTTQGMTVYL